MQNENASLSSNFQNVPSAVVATESRKVIFARGSKNNSGSSDHNSTKNPKKRTKRNPSIGGCMEHKLSQTLHHHTFTNIHSPLSPPTIRSSILNFSAVEKRMDIMNSSTNLITMETMSSVEDVFVHILRHFFSSSSSSPSSHSSFLRRGKSDYFQEGESRQQQNQLDSTKNECNLVDGRTIRNIMLVSKHWHKIGNSVKLWSRKGLSTKCAFSNNAANKEDIIGDHPAAKQNHNIQTWVDISTPPARQRHSSSSMNKHLVGFANLGLQSKGSEGLCYKAMERSTGNFYAIKIPTLSFANRSTTNTTTETAKWRSSQPCEALRELTMMMRLSGPKPVQSSLRGHVVDFIRFDKDNNIKRGDTGNMEISLSGVLQREASYSHSHVNLPERIEIVNHRLLRWYRYVDYSMEDCLKQRMMRTEKQGVCFSTGETKHLLSQLLKALHSLHSRGIVHRNLKPKHLLLSFEGATGAVNDSNSNKQEQNVDFSRATLQISDFSSLLLLHHDICNTPNSHLMGNGRTVDSVIRPKMCTSLWYRSPEILMSEKFNSNAQTAAVDMWSVGVLFAEMMNGKPLFRGNNEIDQLEQIFQVIGCSNSGVKFPKKEWSQGNMKAYVPALSGCNAGLDLLGKLLECDPSKRITTADALNHPFFQAVSEDSKNPTSSQGIYRKPSTSVDNISSLVRHLRNIEILHHVTSSSPNRIVGSANDNQLRVDQWAILVDWMVEVVDVFDVQSSRIVFMAMAYFDRFLASDSACLQNLNSKKYQLIAATCLHISSKCDGDDTCIIGIPDLVFCADNTFRGSDIVVMEETILRRLKWTLTEPVLLDFCNLYMSDLFLSLFSTTNDDAVSRASFVESNWMAKYLAELALQCKIYVNQYKPSLVASCVVCLALHFTGHANAWPERLEVVSGFQLNQLEECMMIFWNGMNHIRITYPDLRMIHKSFTKKDKCCVSKLYPLPSNFRFADLSSGEG